MLCTQRMQAGCQQSVCAFLYSIPVELLNWLHRGEDLYSYTYHPPLRFHVTAGPDVEQMQQQMHRTSLYLLLNMPLPEADKHRQRNGANREERRINKTGDMV